MKLQPGQDLSATLSTEQRQELLGSPEGYSRLVELVYLRELSITGTTATLAQLASAADRFLIEGKTPDQPDPVGLRSWLNSPLHDPTSQAHQEYALYAAPA